MPALLPRLLHPSRLPLGPVALLALLAACGRPGLPLPELGDGGAPPEDPCLAARGYCQPLDGTRPLCRPGYAQAGEVSFGCQARQICCLPSSCPPILEEAWCRAAGCRWRDCPPNADCAARGFCSDPCGRFATQASCEQAICRWQRCAPNEDCTFRCREDCRTAGCSGDRRCQPCWGSWECLPPGSVC